MNYILKKNFKVLLLSILTEKNAIITEELGICSIGACLRKEGYDVKIINTSRTYLNMKEIYSYSPNIIGIPMYSTTENVVSEACQVIRKHLPNTIFVLGGYWPTLAYKELLEKYECFDYVIVGEGEIPFVNFARAVEEKKIVENIRSLVYRKNGEIIANEREPLIADLDELPYAARDLLGRNMLRYAYISTSRGCMANCSFCWHRHFWGTNRNNCWRGRSPQNIVGEIKQLVEENGINRFWFIDNSFEDHAPGDKDRMLKIAQGIIDSKVNISYETYFRAEVYKRFTPESIEIMRKSGLVGTIIGIESGNKEDLLLYRKRASVEDNYKVIEFFRHNGIAVDIGFINFNPYSTFTKLRKNAKYLYDTKYGSVLYYFVERCGITSFSDMLEKVNSDGLLLDSDAADPYAYRYECDSVGKLSDFLYYRFHGNKDSKEYFYSKKIGSIIREEFKLLNHIKRHYNEAVPIVEAAEELFWENIEKVNEHNTKGFLELVDLAEFGWDEQKAEDIANSYWNLQIMHEMSNKIEYIRLKLYMDLGKIGVSPNVYFMLEK